MKNFKLYLSIIAGVGIITFGCKDVIQDEDGDNKKDGITIDKVEKQKSDAVEMADPDKVKTKVIKIELQSKSESDATGTIKFEEKAGQVAMEADFEGLNPGTHAIHLHENANCSSADGKTAGGHWNPTNEPHGKWGDAEGYHKGDIGNFEVGEDGKALVNFETSEWCIDCDDENKNIIGRSVIIHQGGDDFTSQPSGDAGKRIGCAEIKDYATK
ncbi:superoxide dismutase [Brumimicrobium salinarum]|uniref:Superoxide dismutase [Cu-Zn] n=1 Tax=Brumimicrobium salinarum TaxID=2058658 RepID=A0A2I0R026_9FLAO|nr:superoxide dismutase family protein [Brumimicrobium salinarum]PKR79928.1 superoxide dismutase [Brumimicrobium salinarum]